MTIIEKGPSKVQAPSPSEPRSGFIKTPETRRELRSPEKSGRKDNDLISTATSALRRLHFRSAGGSRPKRGKKNGGWLLNSIKVYFCTLGDDETQFPTKNL